jgi:succinate dehydrogenase / fumarate reductase iron-sulfur subunit
MGTDDNENQKMRKVSLEVRTYDPQAGRFVTNTYNIETSGFSTVLESLIHIKETIDPKLSFRYSCRMGICGSCGMVVNGEPRLACETVLSREKPGTIRVAPMQGHPLLKGLVPDFDDFFEKHKEVMPWIIRKNKAEKYSSKKEYPQTDAEIDKFLPFAECIKCGICTDACPVANTNKEFLGPQALAQSYRYYEDSKDQGATERLGKLDTMEGIWGCEFSGSCSRACPKSVDPALAIQLLKSEVARYRITGKAKE